MFDQKVIRIAVPVIICTAIFSFALGTFAWRKSVPIITADEVHGVRVIRDSTQTVVQLVRMDYGNPLVVQTIRWAEVYDAAQIDSALAQISENLDKMQSLPAIPR